MYTHTATWSHVFGRKRRLSNKNVHTDDTHLKKMQKNTAVQLYCCGLKVAERVISDAIGWP